MIRCMNCSSSQHEIEDCTVDTKNKAERDVVREASKAAHGKDNE
jgi:hypothetical protein